MSDNVTTEGLTDPVARLITTYHELNSSRIDEFDEGPSPLEFMRFVSRNRPFVVRKAAVDWLAYTKWDAEYLRDTLKEQEVNVSVTPLGNADAVVERTDGSLAFVQPCEWDEPFSGFLSYVQHDTRQLQAGEKLGYVQYAQTQNDNLREEYRSLFRDVPPSIDFARIALDKSPDAVNFWLGNSRSVTAPHKDNYENIYVQIRGQKHFVLMPPVEMPCMNEQALPQTRYEFTKHGERELEIVPSDDTELLPVALWDPDEPQERTSQWSHLSRPMRVTLDEGDLLYLPAMWFHKVSQTEGPEGFACAVNYWYDMEFAGGFWACNAFVRDVVNTRVDKAEDLEFTVERREEVADGAQLLNGHDSK